MASLSVRFLLLFVLDDATRVRSLCPSRSLCDERRLSECRPPVSILGVKDSLLHRGAVELRLRIFTGEISSD